MWTNLIDKLQQKLDDAADLLGDEESNEEGKSARNDELVTSEQSARNDAAGDGSTSSVAPDVADAASLQIDAATHGMPHEAELRVAQEACVADEPESQLLRFQRQLAEEMQRVSTLGEENVALKDALAQTEHALRTAQEQLTAAATVAASAQDVTLLIDKLGKEKERGKALVRERDAAQERISELEGIVEEYEMKEAHWRISQETQTRNDDAVHARVAELERACDARDAQLTRLRLRVAELEQARDALEAALHAEREASAQALVQARSSSSDATRYLGEELDRVRAAAQEAVAESEQRIAELEQALAEANDAAHFAEMRVAEGEARSVSTLHELRDELAEHMALAAQRGTELASVRAEYDALRTQHAAMQKKHAAAERASQELVAAHKQARSEAEAAQRRAEEQCSALQQRLQRALEEVEHAAATAFTKDVTPALATSVPVDEARESTPNTVPVRAMSEALASSLTVPTRQAMPGSSRALSMTGTAQSSECQPSRAWPTPRLPRFEVAGIERGASHAFAASPAPPMFGHAAPDMQNRGRLERELVRQSVELERLRGVEATATLTRRELDELQRKHNLLMQLYGQLAESVGQAPPALPR